MLVLAYPIYMSISNCGSSALSVKKKTKKHMYTQMIFTKSMSSLPGSGWFTKSENVFDLCQYDKKKKKTAPLS